MFHIWFLLLCHQWVKNTLKKNHKQKLCKLCTPSAFHSKRIIANTLVYVYLNYLSIYLPEYVFYMDNLLFFTLLFIR